MMNYLFESSLCLTLFYGFYHFFLAKDNSYHFNRYYLLAGLIFAVLIPLIEWPLILLPENALPLSIWPLSPESGAAESDQPGAPVFGGLTLLWMVYELGCMIMFLRMARNLRSIWKQVRNGRVIPRGDHELVLVQEDIAPFSFGRFFFFSEKKYLAEGIVPMLYHHEWTHIRQQHTWDILLLESIQIVFWFNPVLMWYKNAVKLNHEYLSDQSVIRKYPDAIAYQQLLFQYMRAQNANSLSSSLHFSLTKKRFQMMPFHSVKSSITWKQLWTLPLFLLVFLIFSVSLEGQTKPPPPPPVHVDPPQEVADMPPPPPPVVEFIEKRPSQQDLQNWKDNSGYGVWLDNQQLNNKDLSTKKPADFGWFYVSKVLKNAKNYGKYEFEVHLYSKAHFEEYMKKKK